MHTFKRPFLAILLLCLVSCSLLLGCKARPVDSTAPASAGSSLPPEQTSVPAVTVAPFTQAFSDQEILFGEVPPGSETAPVRTLRNLDVTLQGAVRANLPNTAVGPCMESTPAAAGNERALDRWVAIGQCAGATYLLVPQVAYWVEREGGPLGSDRPAGVVVDFAIVDVPGHSIAGHFRYNETQVPLTSNLFTVDKFLARGGQFVLASDLAREGVQLAVKRLGL